MQVLTNTLVQVIEELLADDYGNNFQPGERGFFNATTVR